MTEPALQTNLQTDAVRDIATEPDDRQPIGAVGVRTEAFCRCGAGRHPELANRCAAGHVVRNNQLAAVTGEHSAAFWREHETAKRELRDAVLTDAGHTIDDAPRALVLAAESLAQAALIQASAYDHMVQSGGALAASGRVRRAFVVWDRASDRLDRMLRLVGLNRRARTLPTFQERLADAFQRKAERERANQPDSEQS